MLFFSLKIDFVSANSADPGAAGSSLFAYVRVYESLVSQMVNIYIVLFFIKLTVKPNKYNFQFLWRLQASAEKSCDILVSHNTSTKRFLMRDCNNGKGIE